MFAKISNSICQNENESAEMGQILANYGHDGESLINWCEETALFFNNIDPNAFYWVQHTRIDDVDYFNPYVFKSDEVKDYKISKGEAFFHAIEIMACKGGCVGGGGQPYHHGDFGIVKKRAQGLQDIDNGKAVRKSHENKYVQDLYKNHLGKPMSHKAHELLHTKYFPKHKI